MIKERVSHVAKVLAVVKADAYGHGAVQCARRLAKEGAEWFGVAKIPEEGIELRAAGIGQPILVLGGFWDGQAAACIRQRLTTVVYRLDMIAALDQVASETGGVADFHVKVDTGMGRLGVRMDQFSGVFESSQEISERACRWRIDSFRGCPTTMPASRSRTFRFVASMKPSQCFASTVAIQLIYLANSAGIHSHPETWGNMVRPGGVLYGLWRDVLPTTISDAGSRQVIWCARASAFC